VLIFFIDTQLYLLLLLLLKYFFKAEFREVFAESRKVEMVYKLCFKLLVAVVLRVYFF